jgi:ornithine carbamoyltransferase
MNLKGRSLTTLLDLSDEELLGLLNLADELKIKKRAGVRGELLAGKLIALLFEKSSTRTRCAAIAAAVDEGGSAEYLDVEKTHLGKKESVADTARVLGRMFDGILFRGYKQMTVETLVKYAGIPVWNGLTDDHHPTQILADLMTLRESMGDLAGLKIAYLGDGRNNVASSLMLGCAHAGVNFVNCTPPELAPTPELIKTATAIASRNNCTVSVDADPESGVQGANAVYTDVWISMGEKTNVGERVELLRPYQVNMEMMRATGNLETERVILLHCLPAFHDHNTEVTDICGALEVTDEVFESPFSKVFDQAENRVHTTKALMVATMADVDH